ncbi:MAG: hypothetical protein WAL67_12430, partial [Candidatus Cybelea sp.]
MGTSLEQTPLPVDQSGGTSQAPATRESPQDDASDDPSEEVAPVSDSASPSAAPTRSAALRSTGLRFACRHPALAGRRACDAIVQT